MRTTPALQGLVLGILAGVMATPAFSQDQTATSLDEALTSGETHIALRYRYEFVDQDFNTASGAPFTDDAHASTLRVRLNHRSGAWRDWSAFGEFDYIGELLFKDFNNTVDPGRGQYPVVADPKGADLNQLYLDYIGFADTTLRIGRQRITLDNHRFVGNVVWRQNEQTYDAISGTFKGLARTEIFYAYVGTANRIFGERSAVGKDHMNTHLLNVNIGLNDSWKVIPYVYYIDSDDFAAFSTSTVGARVTGKLKAGDGNVALAGEAATQSEAGNAPVDFNARYYHADAMWTLGNGLSLGAGFESLGGDDTVAGKAFRTPLATGHAFQGWADQFLVTPNAGIDDVYGKVGYKTGKWSFLGVYHDFSAQTGGADWGTELDAVASRKLGDRYSLMFKAAWFNADNAAYSDVTKLWLMLTADY